MLVKNITTVIQTPGHENVDLDGCSSLLGEM